MADIFMTYGSQDRGKARALAEALAARDWSVWWVRKIPFGESFDAVIEKALGQARCLIVLWSTQSVESKWVRNEGSDGENRRIRSPGLPHPEFERLLERVPEMLGQAAGAGATTAAHAELLRANHEPPIDQTKHFSWPRVSPGSYLLIGHRPMSLPAPSADQSGKPSGAGTRVTSSGSTSATAPATQSVPEGPLGRASTVASGVGQIPLNWNGANSVGWKVLDADRRTALRNLRTGAKGSDSQDLPPGDYVFALDATGFQPIPVTVRNGQATTVAP